MGRGSRKLADGERKKEKVVSGTLKKTQERRRRAAEEQLCTWTRSQRSTETAATYVLREKRRAIGIASWKAGRAKWHLLLQYGK
ncbi:unnamed protein product [Tetraodon nigroviridis]|uniref:(spotted green pufferfish) hypothetical protein n=1 Tax=Tetraodon nigroviridis TaxID=99883 RepID=Q4T5A7_TETNG|nr:unnamed protein product [Tetraodon nigroviridis]